MLRAEGTESAIVNALKRYAARHQEDWIIVEVKATFSSASAAANTNVIVLSIGPVLDDVFLITNVVVDKPKNGLGTKIIRLREKYSGLPDYTRNQFRDVKNMETLQMRVEVNQTTIVFDNTYKFSEHIHEESVNGSLHQQELNDVVNACSLWFEELIQGSETKTHDGEGAVKDGDILYVLGRNRRVYVPAGEDNASHAYIVYQGQRVLLADAKKIEKNM